MRPKGTAEQLEQRRLRAVRLLKGGKGVGVVAELLGVDPCTVSRWKSRYQKGGMKALRAKKHPGPRPRLGEHEKQELLKELLRGPGAHGYKTELWTCRRIGELIRRRFGVSYHPDYVGQMMKILGWSCQKPQSRPLERDERAIRKWVARQWPRIKKSSASSGTSGLP